MKSVLHRSASTIQRQYGYVQCKDRPKALVCMALSAIISICLIALIISILL